MFDTFFELTVDFQQLPEENWQFALQSLSYSIKKCR